MRVAPTIKSLATLAALSLAGCAGVGGTLFPEFPGEHNAPMGAGIDISPGAPPPVIRQPVLPEYLVGCRGHVLVPALGMTFIRSGAPPPPSGQYLREERLTAPYRIVRPGDRLSQDRNPQRLNVELDTLGRIIGLACG
ncbi:MAG: I78 family peptidase inhibitor [Rhodospirillaceae bacterium]|nr:I78 family peptidase inhibitor [Rhodospirillaceae bacterium]